MEDNYTYDQAALSRSEADLNADVQDPEPKYDQPPLSRIEYLLQQIAGGISSGIHLRGVVSSDEGLPETAENGDMYFVGPDADGAYREVVWLNSKEDWEELGYNAIDVDAFVRKAGDTMTGTLYNRSRRGFQYGYKLSSGMYAVEFDTMSDGMGCHLYLRNLPNAEGQTIYNVADALTIRLRENATTPGVYNFTEVCIPNGMAKEPGQNALTTVAYVDAKVSSEFESNLLSYIDAHTITQAAYDALTDKTGFWFIKEAAT